MGFRHRARRTCCHRRTLDHAQASAPTRRYTRTARHRRTHPVWRHRHVVAIARSCRHGPSGPRLDARHREKLSRLGLHGLARSHHHLGTLERRHCQSPHELGQPHHAARRPHPVVHGERGRHQGRGSRLQGHRLLTQLRSGGTRRGFGQLQDTLRTCFQPLAKDRPPAYVGHHHPLQRYWASHAAV